VTLSATRPVQREIEVAPAPTVCAALHAQQRHFISFDGDGAGSGWLHGPLVAVAPRVEIAVRSGAARRVTRAALAALGRLVAARRRTGGPSETGIAALLAYDLGSAADERPAAGRLPALVAWSIDRSLRFLGSGRALWSGPPTAREPGAACQVSAAQPPAPAAGLDGALRSSLPRSAYLRAVRRLQAQIAEGTIYQANLCRTLSGAFRGDPFLVHRRLLHDNPAPHAAFVRARRWALASASPEAFLRVREPGRIETWPIKGTRPRGSDPAADRAAARELVQSEKDRAELVMIVDLERNDLSRVCRPGTVRVREPGTLRSFPSVHHLVAVIEGELRPELGVDRWIEAAFPGGSISGAPKLRAIELLDRIEPVRRGLFTGSLFWFGDDGRTDSSILIRTIVFDGARFHLGVGSGIVADSEAEQEWRETGHKARALARALGFEPEEAP